MISDLNSDHYLNYTKKSFKRDERKTKMRFLSKLVQSFGFLHLSSYIDVSGKKEDLE
jgi:hypothetical protein